MFVLIVQRLLGRSPARFDSPLKIVSFQNGSLKILLLSLLMAAATIIDLSSLVNCAMAQAPEAAAAKDDAPAPAKAVAFQTRVVSVPLPLRGGNDDRVIEQLQAAAADLPSGGTVRPLLIVEFQPAEGTDGSGSEFESALKVARLLTGERLAGIRTVAFVPRSITGHGVLDVIACDEIIMAAEAELGSAGIDESEITPLLRASYEEIAQRRRTVATSVALAMLDRQCKLLKIDTPDGTRIILDSELSEIEKSTTVTAVNTIKPEGSLAMFTGAAGRHELGFVSHLASDREQLAAALKISPLAFEENPLATAVPKAVRIDFDGPVTGRHVTRAMRLINDQLAKNEVNLIFLWIRSEGGSLREAVRFSEFLSLQIDHKRIRTVAYVAQEARGAASLIALSTDELVMESDSVIGGQGVGSDSSQALDDVLPRIQALMESRQRTWSPAVALLGRAEPLHWYTHMKRGEKRLLSDSELSQLKDRDDYRREGEAIDLTNPIYGAQAQLLGLATHQAQRFNDVKTFYHVEGEIASGRANWALGLIERLADRRISGLLLFIGTFALFSELSSPGLGFPGFLAAVCFLLFFWANFLHGNADLLELLLFVAGLMCVMVEIFVAPGTMVFGVGGGLMVVISVVLASQTFIIPTNVYQLQQLPGSLLMAAGAGAGGLIGIVVLQRFLPQTPYFKRLILQPPPIDEAREIQRRESLASHDALLGKRGIALTPLVPSGKARFGDELVNVISDGPLVEAGSEITVIETTGNRIRVRVLGQ